MLKLTFAAVALTLGIGAIASGPAEAGSGMAFSGSGSGAMHGGGGGPGGHPGFGRPGHHGGFNRPGLQNPGSGLSVNTGPGWRRSGGPRHSGSQAHWRNPWPGGWGYGIPYWGYGAPYWGDGVPYASDNFTAPEADFYGYFGSGGEVRIHRGQPFYDYDRGYPYEWYKPLDMNVDLPGERTEPQAFHCELQSVPGSRGKQVEIRVCRGS